MKVTSEMLQTGANYAVIMNTEYEIAEGICVRLKDPTIALSRVHREGQGSGCVPHKQQTADSLQPEN